MSYKHLFSRSLSAAPDRLHLAAHSHHLWPDASFDGQVECWNDAARLADRKWDRVMGECGPKPRPRSRPNSAAAIPSAIVFAANTHDFIIRLAAAVPRANPARLRVLTSDGEFHSARRQFARWAEDGWLELDDRPRRPGAAERRAGRGKHDLIMVSQVQFGTGQIVADRRARRPRPARGPVGGDRRLSRLHGARRSVPGRQAAATAFYLAGGYKYAMAGEGMGLMHCPPGFGPRPPITGWYAEFGDLTAAARRGRLHQRRDALHGRDLRSLGAVPLRRHPPDAGRRRADDRHHQRPCRGAPEAIARCDRGHGAGRGRAAQPAGRPAPRPLPRLPIARRGGMAAATDGGAIASPTCAATCSASGLACITIRPTSPRSASSRRTLA